MLTYEQLAETFPPGEFIKEEIEERGWSQRDLADIMGVQPSIVSALIKGTKPITLDIARNLSAAFGSSAQYWVNLDTAYRLNLPAERHGYVALVDDEDYLRVSQHKWYAAVKRRKDGTVRSVHAARNTYPCSRKQSRALGKNHITKRVWLHSFILNTKEKLDHKDGNGLHNWRSNLRVATTAQNRHNSPAPVNNTSGCKGVSWNKRQKRWGAYIQHKHLGWFTDKTEAAKARVKAEQELYGEFARTEAACRIM